MGGGGVITLKKKRQDFLFSSLMGLDPLKKEPILLGV